MLIALFRSPDKIPKRSERLKMLRSAQNPPGPHAIAGLEFAHAESRHLAAEGEARSQRRLSEESDRMTKVTQFKTDRVLFLPIASEDVRGERRELRHAAA